MGKATQELKYKRLKVGHACYVCRSKKIKCDGLRPCMQCKARGRNCQSSNPEQQQDNDTTTTTESGAGGYYHDDNDTSSHSNIESDDDSILFSRTKKPTFNDNNNNNTSKSIPTYNESWTCNTIRTASENFEKDKQLLHHGLTAEYYYPTFGSFVRWREEPPLPLKYSCPIEMPSSEIQMHLIDLFFQTRYKITPMIPKRLFYQQLGIKGPIITPFLLNSIYCVVSGYSTLPDVPKPAVFYNRAKKLLDDFLDTPRVSTVAALCLLALYEPLPPTKSRNMADQHCRSWMYSGMAFRMCLELGLNIDTPHTRANNNMSLEHIEFSRRVFWSCYCLDKMQSAEWERLWAIPSSLAKTALPQVLPGDDDDDDDEERWIVMAYEQKIRLALISEEGLQIRASFAIRDDIMDEKFFDQLEQYRLKILKWRQDLKSPELWGLAHCDTMEQVINEPKKKSSVMSYLHIVYYFMLTDALFCLPDDISKKKKSLEQRIYASQLTKSVDILCDQPAMVIRYEFLAHATIAAIRVHARYLNDPDPEISCQSWGFFNQCVKILRKFQKHAIIPECSAVLNHLPLICQYNNTTANESNNNSSSINPAATSSSSSSTLAASPQSFDELTYDGGVNSFKVEENALPPPQQQQQQVQTLQQQQEAIYNSRLIDPFRTDISSIPSYGYQNMDNNNMLMSSPYSSLTAFGTTLGIDFGDRRQLWECALQDAIINDISSIATTPDDSTNTNTQSSYNSNSNEWTTSPPKISSEFIWPAAPTQQQQQNGHNSNSPPPSIMQHHQQLQQQQLTSSPSVPSHPHHQQQQLHQHLQQQQQQQKQYISSSSSCSPHHHDMNSILCNPSSSSFSNINSNPLNPYNNNNQQPPLLHYQTMTTDNNNMGGVVVVVPRHVYYPN